MAKTRVQKKELMAAYTAKLKSTTGFVAISQSGLKPAEITEFKKKLHGLGSQYHVVKNTVFARALAETNLPAMDSLSFGPHAIIFVESDIAGAAKALDEFIKAHADNVEVRGGILEGQSLTIEQVKDLANLPSKEQSVAMIAGLLQNPIVGVANVLQDSVRSIAIILDKAFTDK